MGWITWFGALREDLTVSFSLFLEKNKFCETDLPMDAGNKVVPTGSNYQEIVICLLLNDLDPASSKQFCAHVIKIAVFRCLIIRLAFMYARAVALLPQSMRASPRFSNVVEPTPPPRSLAVPLTTTGKARINGPHVSCAASVPFANVGSTQVRSFRGVKACCRKKK